MVGSCLLSPVPSAASTSSPMKRTALIAAQGSETTAERYYGQQPQFSWVSASPPARRRTTVMTLAQVRRRPPPAPRAAHRAPRHRAPPPRRAPPHLQTPAPVRSSLTTACPRVRDSAAPRAGTTTRAQAGPEAPAGREAPAALDLASRSTASPRRPAGRSELPWVARLPAWENLSLVLRAAPTSAPMNPHVRNATVAFATNVEASSEPPAPCSWV